MDDPQSEKPNSQSPNMQEKRKMNYPKRAQPGEISRLMSLSEAERELGLNDYQVYLAVHRGELHVVQPGGRGRKWYLADELQALAKRLSNKRLTNEAAA